MGKSVCFDCEVSGIHSITPKLTQGYKFYFSDVMFKDGDSFRKYIWSLHKSQHTLDACDVLYWVDTMVVKGKLRLFACPNIASYMNSGRHPNVLPKHHMSPKMWATTDIKKGEEILTDYSAYPTDWAAVGL